MNSLKSLTFVVAPPKTISNPTTFRRERLVHRLQEQLQLAKDPAFAPVVTRWKRGDGGGTPPVDPPRRIKPWWKVDGNGFAVLSVRYGFKTLEFEKGKGAIAAGTIEKLEGVLTTLIAATRAGELDGVLEAPTGRSFSKNKKSA